MEENGFAFIDGKFTSTPGFSDPILRKYDYMHREIEFVEHRHEEPLIYGLNASKYYKGLKNAYFKYSGVGIDFAKQMARVGLLTKKRFLYKGIRIHPLNFLEFLISKTPKSEKEIADIIKEGFYSDVLYAVVEVHGKKNKKDIRIEMHIFSPGLAESFRMKKMTAEQFLTAQSAGAYTKMMVEDKFQNHGLIFSDELNPTQIDQYLDEVEKLGITYEKRTINVKQQIKA
jgi:saccharopine dehydrogenase-like NADP-dependent oxidoreductase